MQEELCIQKSSPSCTMALILKYPILGCTGTLYGAIHTNWSRLRYSFSSHKFEDLKTKKT
jgi:hypothetical protein